MPPPPSYDAQGKLICPDSAITITATTNAPTFAAGSQPIVGMVITNTGTETCQRDVSGTLQAFTVLAADGSRVWSTVDCFPGEGTEVRELAPGQTLKYTIKWSGTTSQPGCAGDRSVVPAGDYTLVAQLGGLSARRRRLRSPARRAARLNSATPAPITATLSARQLTGGGVDIGWRRAGDTTRYSAAP